MRFGPSIFGVWTFAILLALPGFGAGTVSGSVKEDWPKPITEECKERISTLDSEAGI